MTHNNSIMVIAALIKFFPTKIFTRVVIPLQSAGFMKPCRVLKLMQMCCGFKHWEISTQNCQLWIDQTFVNYPYVVYLHPLFVQSSHQLCNPPYAWGSMHEYAWGREVHFASSHAYIPETVYYMTVLHVTHEHESPESERKASLIKPRMPFLSFRCLCLI